MDGDHPNTAHEVEQASARYSSHRPSSPIRFLLLWRVDLEQRADVSVIGERGKEVSDELSDGRCVGQCFNAQIIHGGWVDGWVNQFEILWFDGQCRNVLGPNP